jgi:two-component system cell cycle response regulator PopA
MGNPHRLKEASVPVHARVLILARDDSLAGDLAEGLDRLGWRTITAQSLAGALAALADLQIEAAVIDTASYGDESEGLAARLKAASGQRLLPVIGIGAPGAYSDCPAFDLTLPAPPHPAQTALRLESLVRTAVSEEEFALRSETFTERGRRLEMAEDDPTPFRVLAVGEPAPQFLALSNALAAKGIDVVGAFTPYTAFDYLHERPFEAVVLWAGDDPAEALSIAAGMRRNTRLFHIPTLLYLQSGAALGLSEVYHRGISDVATPRASEADTAARVVELARAHRRQSAIRKALEKAKTSGLMDAATGLFTRDLFAAHLARLAAASAQRNRPLSVCVLKLAERSDLQPMRAGGWVDRAIPQIGSMVARLVRAEDTAARLGPEVFALALPATPLHAARAAAERIAAVIGCTAFDAGENRTPFVVEFDIGVAQVEAGESAAKALERAAAKVIRAKAG